MNRLSYNSGLRKISISCKTCDVSESFYSGNSIQRFKVEHVGHEVIEENMDALTGGPRTEPANGRQDSETGERVRLLKVLVELVMLPAYPSPVFTITGVKEDLKSAFVQVVSPSQSEQVRETLEKGKYLAPGSTDTVYFWEKKAVSISEDATMAMSFGPYASVGSKPAEPNPVTEEPLQRDAPSNSGDAQEIQIATSRGEQSGLAITEVAPHAEPAALPAPQGPSDSAGSPPISDSFPRLEASSPAPAQPNAVAAASDLSREPEAPSQASPEPREVSIPASSAGKEEAATRPSENSQQAKVEEDGYLLVSKSWYIEKGPKNMNEAVRISRILRPFRWRIEPAYTIGVILDDILSVETANGEIGGDITSQIERAGYKLTRVSVEKGKPVAWFKRENTADLA